VTYILHHLDGGYEIVETRNSSISPIDWNKQKVDELEKEWALNGPLREITFITNFWTESGVQDFAKAATDNGFQVEITDWTPGATYRHIIRATRLMVPSADDITRWEEWFIEQADKIPDYVDEDNYGEIYPGAEFEGWAYPPKYRPSFSLYGSYKSIDYQKKKATAARTRIIFGSRICDFEASNGWADQKGLRNKGSFQIQPSEFIESAKRRKPNDPEPTASGFSQWLYSLYSSKFGKYEDLERGSTAEGRILEFRKKAFASVDNNIVREQFSGWKLSHCGMNVSKNKSHDYFLVEDLLVRGQPLRINPDLVFTNNITGSHIIVEIKHSYMTLPTNLWPNIWGQLWCYAQLPAIRKGPSVTVVGEVWGDSINHLIGTHDVYLRASVRRDPRAPAYDRFFRTLFDIYRGA